MSTKNEVKRERSKAFVRALEEHNPGKSIAELQAEIGVADEYGNAKDGDEYSEATGRTFRRWSKGKEGVGDLKRLQVLARIALRRGLLPPLREGCIRRADVFCTQAEQQADELWEAQRKRLAKVEQAREKAIEALEAYSSALKEVEADHGVVTLDTSSRKHDEDPGEVHYSRVDAVIKEISDHAEYRLW